MNIFYVVQALLREKQSFFGISIDCKLLVREIVKMSRKLVNDALYQYCDWFKRKFGENVRTANKISFLDETRFHLSGWVNSKNYRIQSTSNSHVFEETSLHPMKVGVWCGMSKERVVWGPILFEKTIKTAKFTSN